MHCGRVDLSETIDVTKRNSSKECIVCHYWFFNHGFEFQNIFGSGCHDLTMFCLNLSDITIITAKGVHYQIFLGEMMIFDQNIIKQKNG